MYYVVLEVQEQYVKVCPEACGEECWPGTAAIAKHFFLAKDDKKMSATGAQLALLASVVMQRGEPRRLF